jgi:hypothetical protein
MLRSVAVAATISVLFAATAQAAPIRLSDLGGATATAAVLNGAAVQARNGASIRFADVDDGTAFCVGARSRCRGGAATLSFDTPQSGLDLQVSRLAKKSRAEILIYSGDTLLRRVRVTNSRSLSFDMEGITHVEFRDRSRKHGMGFGVTLPMDNGPTTPPAVAPEELSAVPVPAGLPLMLGALAGLGLLLRRRAR